MASMTFQINDKSTDSTVPSVWVKITENEDGTLSFNVWQEGGIIGDLRGIFFDLADESLVKTLSVNGTHTEFQQGNDTVTDLGDGANMNGLLGSLAPAKKIAGSEGNGFDAGIEIGSAGIGKDDIRTYDFVLSSSLRDLTLADFSNVDFAARLTSVGTEFVRTGSAKLLEHTENAVDTQNDEIEVPENGVLSGNVLDNDNNVQNISESISTSSVKAYVIWNPDSIQPLSTEIILRDGEYRVGTLILNDDGSYSIDVSEADFLSKDEELTYNINYKVIVQNESTSWSEDTSTLQITVKGVNDGPDAQDDDAGTVLESGKIEACVADNDSDVDRLDSHTYKLVEGSFNGLGDLVFNEDGTWSFNTNGAYDSLNEGEEVELSFEYEMWDNHGASDIAKVTFKVQGEGSIVVDPDGDREPIIPVEDFPTMVQDISNIVLYLDDGDSATSILKVKIQPSNGLSIKDIDDLDLYGFLDTHRDAFGKDESGENVLIGDNVELVGISVHAGQEYPNVNDVDGTVPGEGVFYFLGDNEVSPVGTNNKGWTHDWEVDSIPLNQDAIDAGFSNEILLIQAPVYQFAEGGWYA